MTNRNIAILVVSLVVLCMCCACLTVTSLFLYNRYKNPYSDLYFNEPIVTTSPTVTISPFPINGTVTPTPPSTTPSTADCVPSGCSGTLCLEIGSGTDNFSTCEWTDAYACYRQARCERQASGSCGWTFTPGYYQCLKDVSTQKPL